LRTSSFFVVMGLILPDLRRGSLGEDGPGPTDPACVRGHLPVRARRARPLAPAARLADGDLDVRIVDGERPLARLRSALAPAIGTLAASPVHGCRAVSSLSLEYVDGRPPGYSIDGEARPGAPRLILRKLTGRLIVYRPADAGT
jgi:hypothetical protein